MRIVALLSLLLPVGCEDGHSQPGPASEPSEGEGEADVGAGEDAGPTGEDVPVKPVRDTGPECQVVPGAIEKCNGLDDDCDGLTDEGDPLLGADCEVDAAGCSFPGTQVCLNAGLQCQSGRSSLPGTLPHVSWDGDGHWLISLMKDGAEPIPGGGLQVFLAVLEPGGDVLELSRQISRSQVVAPRPGTAFAVPGGRGVAWLGPAQPMSQEIHLMTGWLDGLEAASLDTLDPTEELPANVRPAVATLDDGTVGIAYWDGRRDPGGIRFVRPGGQPVTPAGGAAAWADLASDGDAFNLAFVRPGHVVWNRLSADGATLGQEEPIATAPRPQRVRLAGDRVAWLAVEEDGRSAQVHVTALDPELPLPDRILDRAGRADLAPSIVRVGERTLVAWTRDTNGGPEVVVAIAEDPHVAVPIGPGEAPVLALGPDGVGVAFDRGGQVHFLRATCQ